jgi:tripartite-type tricarboxylate transporter receptor subunit TctC
MAKKVLRMMLLVFLFPTLSPLCGITWGGEFPTRSIELIIPWAPGGPSDTMGRIVAPELGKILGQPVVPVNKPGASGALGAALLAKAKPDGYTILIVSNSSLTVFPHFEKVAYDPLTDFTYLGKLYNQFPGLYVRIDAPWKTFEEFLDFAKKNPKKIKYGTWGQYCAAHICMEAIAKEKSVEWVHVPFKGDGPCITALLGGHLDAAANTAGHTPYLRAGKIRGLTMLRNARSLIFPEIPSLRDVGVKFESKGSTNLTAGMIAPKGLPKEIIKKYEKAFEEVTKSPKFLEVSQNIGLEPDFVRGDEFHKETEEGYKYVLDYVKKLGFK